MSKIVVTKPSSYNRDEAIRRDFRIAIHDKNQFRYWFPWAERVGLTDNRFYIPETIIIPLTVDWFEWLGCDHYEDSEIRAFSDYLLNYMDRAGFNRNRDLFVKTGLFSDKFWFKHPYVPEGDIQNIGNHALSCAYSALCVGCRMSADIVVREFVKTHYNRGTIYEGMKLNSEFRVFYDFDNNKVIGVVDYWDKDTMIKSLDREYSRKDYLSYMDNLESLESAYTALSPTLVAQVEEIFPKVPGLEGQWSVDFMWDGTKFVLIDMALAKNSAYWDKFANSDKKTEPCDDCNKRHVCDEQSEFACKKAGYRDYSK